MTRHANNPLPHLVESFFRDHLQRARGASPHTVRAYCDTLRLLFVHLADTKGCSVTDLPPDDLQVEAIAVQVQDLDLTKPPQVRLHGKGGKDRICPLWEETATALQRLPTVRQADPGDTIFLSSRGKPLSRDGVAYILGKYVRMAANDVPTLRRRRITPHVLRHYLASRTM